MTAKPSTKPSASLAGLVAVLEQLTVERSMPTNVVANGTLTGPRMFPLAQVGTFRFPSGSGVATGWARSAVRWEVTQSVSCWGRNRGRPRCPTPG